MLVCDRNKPVARIVPCHLADRSAQRLVARGVLCRRSEAACVGFVAGTPGNISDEVMERTWREERESRNSALGFLGHERVSSSLRPSGQHASRDRMYKSYEAVVWWGDFGGDCQRPGAAGADEAARRAGLDEGA